MRNPLESEAGAFRALIHILAALAVIVIVVVIIRAL
jgi:hypothetical protein